MKKKIPKKVKPKASTNNGVRQTPHLTRIKGKANLKK